MSARKTKTARRPAARRSRPGSGDATSTAAKAGDTSPRKGRTKRVAARRGKSVGGEPASGQGEGEASRVSSPAGPRRRSPRKSRAARAVASAPEAIVERETPAEKAAKDETPMRPSIRPPGVQIAEDVWETVGEGAPVLAEVSGRRERGSAALEPTTLSTATPTAHLRGSSQVAGPRQGDALGTAQAVLGPEYYYQQWGRQALRRMEADVDDFGFDPRYEARVRPWLERLCRHYFRVQVEGAANLPTDGRVILVANRSGVVPWDGLVLRESLREAAPTAPALRWLAEDSVFHYPFLGVFMNRMGAVRACPENAQRLLTQSRVVAVFPEGARGAGRLFRERYQLQRFGRGGYVRLALRNRATLVPVGIVGGEEAYPLLARSKLLGKLAGVHYLPVTPTFPWLGAAGLLPAPSRWRIVVGEPMALDEYGPEAAEDALAVHRVNERVRGTLQRLLHETARARGAERH